MPAPAGSGSVSDLKRLHAACRLALAVAREGEAAEPRIPAPSPLVPVLRFSRLSTAAYATVARTIDEDEAFRARVAAADGADEHALGRAGWLWLQRPDGWLSDPAVREPSADAAPRARDDRARAKAESSRRREAADADARRRAKEQLATARRQAAEAIDERDGLRARIADLELERSRALRTAKDLERSLADARRDLKVAREATRQAEAELADLRSDLASDAGRAAAASIAPVAAGAPVAPVAPAVAAVDAPDPLDRDAVAEAVGAAAAAATQLARSLAEASAALIPRERATPPRVDVVAATTPAPTKVSKAAKASKASKGKAEGKGRRAAARVLPSLPPGVFDGTPEANRHLLGSGEAVLVVDGYNLARAAWSGIDPQEERRRTVALLEEVRARSKAVVHVVFDGDSSTVGPASSRTVRVSYSPSGVTADDDITRLVASLPASQPVVVVSSDRAVADDARRLGAVAMSTADFLAAAGR